MVSVIIITALLTVTIYGVWMRLVVLEAVRLLNRQRNRVQYPMDDQLATQAEVKEFIRRWK